MSPPPRHERFVNYTVQNGELWQKGFKLDYRAIDSSRIPEVQGRRLRVALELTDIVQAMTFQLPRQGALPGGVTAMMRLPSRCGQQITENKYSRIDSDFPEDTYERLKRSFNEDN